MAEAAERLHHALGAQVRASVGTLLPKPTTYETGHACWRVTFTVCVATYTSVQRR